MATEYPDSTEGHLLKYLRALNTPEADLAAAWVQSLCTITVRYAEFTGGHITQEDMNEVLSDECFGSAIPEREALWRSQNEPR